MKENRFKSILKSNFFLAAMISLVSLILVLLFCGIQYETSDDFTVSALLSGAYNGEYNPHMLFSNVLLGYILAFLYSHTSYISWYFVNLMVIGLVSIFTVNYICLKKNNRVVGVLFAVLATVLLTDDLFISPQFTKTASAAIAAGGLLLIETLFTKSEEIPSGKNFSASRIVSVILAFLLMLSGSLLRISCVYNVAPFVAIMFLIKVIQQRKDEKIVKKVLLKAGCCILLLLGLFMFEFIGNYINDQSPGYREYYSLNSIRSRITDTGKVDYEDYEESFKSLGMDYVDYLMFETWSFSDNDNYPIQRLDEVGKVYQSTFDISKLPSERIINEFIKPNFLNTVYAGCLLLALLEIAFDRKSAGKILLCLLVQLVMLCGFIFIGRCPYRIIYSIDFSLFVSILSCVSIRDISREALRKALVLLTAILVASRVPTYIKDQQFKILPYFDNTAEEPQQNIIKHMENDSEHFYLFDFLSSIQTIYQYYAPWERLPQNYLKDNYDYLCNTTMGYPADQECLEDSGINALNPYKSFINENVYVVDNASIELKLLYLRKHYYPNVNVKLVEVVDGYSIWKFYLE